MDQGGRNTLISYGGGAVPKAHIDFFKNARMYLEFENKLFVHGGFDPGKAIGEQEREYLVWDRSLVEHAWQKLVENPQYRFLKYDEIFVGHTPTQWFTGKLQVQGFAPMLADERGSKPLFLCNVIMLDTGAGWSGKLTIMDVFSHEYWQSDLTPGLYGFGGRNS